MKMINKHKQNNEYRLNKITDTSTTITDKGSTKNSIWNKLKHKRGFKAFR